MSGALVKLTALDEEGETVDLAESRSFSLSVMSNGEVSLRHFVRGESVSVVSYDPNVGMWVANDGTEYADLYLDAVPA